MQIIRSGKKLEKLEAVRGFASVYVVFHHLFAKGLIIAGRDFSILFRFGQEAVILFFLLSGFVIYYAFGLSADKSFRIFFWKRFLRIYIPLTCVFAANYALITLQAHKWITVDLHTLGGNLLMLQDSSNLKPNVIVNPFLRNTPLWSLSYEWWFYMIFFVLITKISKNPSLIVYVGGVIAAATYVLYPNFINRELMYLIIWWAGADMALLYLNKQNLNLLTMKVPLIALVMVSIILIINVRVHNHDVSIGYSPLLELRHFVFAIMTILLAVLWKKLSWAGFRLTFGLFEKIAPISFGIYISHWFLIANATYLNGIVNNVYLRFGLYVLICLLFAYIIERVIYVKLSKLIIPQLIKKVPILPN